MGNNDEKTKQLGMPFGTAGGKLRKMILFHLLKKHKENFCFQCGAEIESVDNLSIEHKKPWLHESVDLFWDMDNIAFSHIKCNVSAARHSPKTLRHGQNGYRMFGCRCNLCCSENTRRVAAYRKNGTSSKLMENQNGI